MQNYMIPYNKDAIVQAVQKITGHTARHVPEGFDRIAATDDERTLTDILFDATLNVIVSSLTDYSAVADRDNGVIMIRNSSGFNTSVLPAVCGSVTDALINGTASKWFFISRELADAEKYSLQAASDFSAILPLLLQRKRPQRHGCCRN